jgi:mannose-6-phosphate isomerase-like protein (cupin superfamily)
MISVRTTALGLACLLSMSWTSIAYAQTGSPNVARAKEFASSADVKAQIRTMLAEMAPDQGFMWRSLVRDGSSVAAIEIWKKPGRPAVHPGEAEYAIVLEGTGTLVSGGTLADPNPRNAKLVEGSRIDGGTTRRLRPGDVMLIPAGVPHWFGIDGDRLILLGIKLPGAN